LGSPFNPGDTPGTLTINGNYVQTGTGTLDIKIGGTIAGEQFDRLVVNGNAMLDGTLTVHLIYSYSPPSGTLFQILVCQGGGTVTGTFASRNLGGRFVDPPTYDPSDVTLQAT
jgi:outer membrane autotransporter protein